MKRPAKASRLSDWQKDDAGRLRQLIAAAKNRGDWPGIDEFASTHIGKSGSYLSQLQSGYRPLNLEHAVGLAKGLGVSLELISPTWAAALVGAQLPAAQRSAQQPPAKNRRSSEYDRSVFRALSTLEPDVQMSIKGMILALASAKSASHAAFMSKIERFNHSRDSAKPAKRGKHLPESEGR